MIRHEMSVHLNRPAEQIFAFLVDPEKLRMWQSSLMRIEQLTPGPLRLGSRFRETRRLGRRESQVEAEISAFEPNRRLATKTSTQPDVRVSYSLDPEQGGARLSYQFVMLTTGLMRILEPVISSSLRKQSDADFAKLKELLEG